MRNAKSWIALLLCLLFLASAAAEPAVSARIDGGVLRIDWTGLSAGKCTLTVYRDGWPIGVYAVNGGDGKAGIPISAPSGRWSVRIRTSNGCLTASVIADGAPPQMPEETPPPRPEATPKPEPPGPTAAPTSVPTTPTTGASRSDLASQVVAQVNAERAKQGLGELRVDAGLTRAACVRAGEITRKFSHTRPDGSSWSTVSGAAFGENIAKGQRTADKVMAAWLSSQGHRENILRASYGSIGVCAYAYNGVVYWVQLFGR